MVRYATLLDWTGQKKVFIILLVSKTNFYIYIAKRE